MEPIKICSLNCQGLGDSKKRKDVFNYLRNKKFNIYFLQDTHFVEKMEPYIRAEWGFECIFNSNSSQSRGVAILFNNNFEYKINDIDRDKMGNLLTVDVTIDNTYITLVNVYGPNQDSPEFYKYLKENCQNKKCIMGGDWNLVMEPDKDYYNYKHVNNPQAREQLLENIDVMQLVDVWRIFHPDITKYTWRRKNPIKQARLDYFLVSDHIFEDVKDCSIEAGYRSDHSLITLTLGSDTYKHRQTYWKFNNSLLRDKEYIKTVKNVISQTKHQYAVPIYDEQSIDKIPQSEIQWLINDQLWLETLLMEIRGKTISYASFKKKEREEKEKELIDIIDDLETNIINTDLEYLENKKLELQEIRKKKMDGAFIRSKAKWIEEGEKLTNYFCNLENRNFVSKVINTIETNEGIKLTDTSDIVKETKSYYEKLYTSRDNSLDIDFNLDTELIDADIPKLTPEESKKLDGKLKYSEVFTALKKMNNNKSPGSDGYTAEFFKFFWPDLGHFLLRSINYGLETGEMSITQRQGLITCIPKKDKPRQLLKNWRPISLLNIMYKLASSCIAERIKTILPKLIHEDQKGFMKGRFIGENTRLLYDIMFYTEKNHTTAMLLLIDFEKAFDSVSWSFMDKVLSFWGVGDSCRKHITTLYKNIKSSVCVNGQVSTWFDIERGCRQGDPLSPYLFLMCAEIMAVMMRKNKQIKGINIEDKEYLIMQYADDTGILLDGSAESLETTIDILKRFANISGLTMNIEKSQVVWLGSRKGSNIRYIPQLKLQWNPEKFTVLGIKFSTDLRKINELNYKNKLEEIKRLINQWSKRILTPLGKITVAKSLLVSRLTYLFMALPDPPDDFLMELHRILFKFIWSNKPDRIARNNICKHYEQGGLKMIDIFKFLKSLKCTWIRRMFNRETKWKSLLLALFPQITKLTSLGNTYVNQCIQRISNPFWKHVLRAYSVFHNNVTISTFSDYLAEPIFYNSNIKIGNKEIYRQDLFDAGLTQVADFYSDNGQIFSWEEFKEIQNIETVNYLEYYGITRSVTKYLAKLNIDPGTHNAPSERPAAVNTLINENMKASQIVYNALISSNSQMKIVTKWESIFEDELEWSKIFLLPKKTTKDTKLRWFQYRLLHRILPSNTYLKKIGIKNDDKCGFCNHDVEDINHLFWHCEKVQTFWNDFIDWIHSNCIHTQYLNLDLQLVLFGFRKNNKTDKGFDLLLLLAKFYIYKCKLKNVPLSLAHFKNEAKSRYKIEKCIAYTSCNFERFSKTWLLYNALLNET